jgi:hypothetical protein
VTAVVTEWSQRVNEGRDRGGGGLRLQTRHDVAVHIQRERDRCVTESFLDRIIGRVRRWC